MDYNFEYDLCCQQSCQFYLTFLYNSIEKLIGLLWGMRPTEGNNKYMKIHSKIPIFTMFLYSVFF